MADPEFGTPSSPIAGLYMRFGAGKEEAQQHESLLTST